MSSDRFNDIIWGGILVVLTLTMLAAAGNCIGCGL